VSDSNTGVGIIQGKTRKEALDKFDSLVKSKGETELADQIKIGAESYINTQLNNNNTSITDTIPIDIQQGGTDAISESQTNEIPSQESSGAVQEMETEVRNESTAPQETGQGEQGQVTPKKKAPTLKELVSSPEARQFRASELLDRINQY